MAWSGEQLKNAAIIVAVGRELGASKRDIRIALMVGMQESGLRNLNYGDRDSVGVFQQRTPWGTLEQRMDVRKSATMFFTGGHGGQRGLFDFADRDQMSLTEAAQAVQVSAYPDAYAKWHDEALDVLSAVGGSDLPGAGDRPERNKKGGYKVEDLSPQTPQDIPGLGDGDARYTPAVQQTSSGTAGVGAYAAPMSREQLSSSGLMDILPDLPGNKRNGQQIGGVDFSGEAGKRWRRRVEKIARRYLGTPYVWGGTTPNGFDCSGFVQYVYGKLGVDLPRISYQQATSGKRINDFSNLKVGDLVAWDNSSRNNGADHIAIYIGNGKIIEAPRPGSSVQVSDLYDMDNAWGVRMKL